MISFNTRYSFNHRKNLKPITFIVVKKPFEFNVSRAKAFFLASIEFLDEF